MRKTAAALVASLLLLAACANQRGGEEISKERAIELARQHLTFEARSVEAEKATDQGRPVWRVNFRGEGPGQGRMGEFLTVSIDRRTGEMVSLGMS
ncbi:MAG TPA: PepSY domain-containing protein [Thermoanaerobaculia bacterium]